MFKLLAVIYDYFKWRAINQRLQTIKFIHDELRSTEIDFNKLEQMAKDHLSTGEQIVGLESLDAHYLLSLVMVAKENNIKLPKSL